MPEKKSARKRVAAKKPAGEKPAAKKRSASKKPPAKAMGWKPGVPQEKPNGRVYDGPLSVNPKPRKADRIFFGTGGVPHSASPKTHPAAVRRLRELGLGTYEMEFVYGVRITPETSKETKAAAGETGVRLTAHGPYYINLYSMEPDKLEASRKRVLDTARALAACGGDGACFHPGFYQGRDRNEVYAFIKDQLADLSAILDEEGCPVRLDPETTGKDSQFGSLDEITRMGGELKRKNLGITIDFAHLHARTAGGLNTYDEFCAELQQIQDGFGKQVLQDLHIHLSGIAYTQKGEAHHLELDESDMNYADLFRALIDFSVEGHVVCESPALEYDALFMQKAYRKLHGS